MLKIGAVPAAMAALSVVCVAGGARAQAPPEAAPQLPSVLTLKDALEIFRRRGLDLIVAEANVKSAQGDLIIAGAVQNPMLSGAAGKNFVCGTSQDCKVISYSVGLSDNSALSDFFTGKRGLRRDVASAALEAARRSRDDAQRTLEFQVKQAYVQAALAQVLLQNARETQESFQRTRDLNQRRFALGAINGADLATIQVAELESEQALDQAGQSLRTSKVALAFLLGFRTLVPDFQLEGKELDFFVPGPLAQATREALLPDALERRPDRLALARQVERARSALSLAHRNRIPDFTLFGSYSANGSGDTNISPPNASIGLSFPLPIFYFQRGEIAKAEADLTTQQALEQKSQALVVSDVETAFAQFGAARRLVERMLSPLLERAQTARDLVRIQYEKGAASLIDFLNAQRTYTATRVEYAQDLAGYWTAVAALEQATAKELRP
jgi:cobalt-zinc-cadmium efflux system outer membrane protein